jgi:large subunit ribosomal protein L4
MELKVINSKGQESGSVQFDETLVNMKASPAVLHEIVVAHLAGQRSGHHSVKTRSMVSGGGHKPWKQKGTGRARSGSTRSPLWRKGGVIFGPVYRDYTVDLPKKKKKLAFRLAFRNMIEEGRLQIVDPIQLSEPKTKNVAAIYEKWKTPTDAILIVDKIDPQFHRAARNIPLVTVTDVATVNTYECLKARRVFVTRGALDQLIVRLGTGKDN